MGHIRNESFALARLHAPAELRGESTHEERVSPLRRVLSFLAESPFFVAVTTSSILYVSFVLQNTFSALLLLSCFFLTASMYTLNNVTDLHEDAINNPEEASFTQRNQKAIALGAVCMLGIALLCAYLFNIYAMGVVLLALCISVLYSVRVFNVRLKDILVMKNVAIATTSACVAVLMPLTTHPEVINAIAPHFSSFALVALLIAYFVFVKVFINTVLFDVRDMHGDRLAGLVTIPVLLGKAKTGYILLALNTTFIPWVLLAALDGFSLRCILVLSASIIYGYWYTLRICRKEGSTRRPFFLLVDGEFPMMAAALGLLFLMPVSLSALSHLLVSL